jgi:acetylornithine deacetylase
MTYGSDMGLLAGVGRTTTVLFGPGDIRRAHRPDESVAVADVELVARSLALLLLRFCGTA